jgi:hypothetical protein
MEGKYDFAVKTNPFGTPKKEPSKEDKAKIDAQRQKFLLYRMDAKHKARK